MDELITHWLGRFAITVGVQTEIEANKSNWLADAIASYQMYAHLKCEEFQVWKLVVHPGHIATLICDDGNGRIVVTQDIEYTDHPMPGTVWWLVGSGGSTPVLMLPEEY